MNPASTLEKPVSDLTIEDYNAELVKYSKAWSNLKQLKDKHLEENKKNHRQGDNNEQQAEYEQQRQEEYERQRQEECISRVNLTRRFDRVLFIILKLSNCDGQAAQNIARQYPPNNNNVININSTCNEGQAKDDKEYEIVDYGRPGLKAGPAQCITVYPFSSPCRHHSDGRDFPPHQIPEHVRESYVADGLMNLTQMANNIIHNKPETYFAIRYEFDYKHLIDNLSMGPDSNDCQEGMPEEQELRNNRNMNTGHFISKMYIKSNLVTLANDMGKDFWMVISGGQDYTYVFTNNKYHLPTVRKSQNTIYDDVFLVTNVVIGFVDRVVKLTVTRLPTIN